MLKPLDLVFVCMVLAAATATYVVKYGSQIKHSSVAKLEHKIEVEKEAIDILNANWSLLTSPARLQDLSEAHKDELQLQDLDPKQIIRIEDIPMRPIELPKSRNAQNLQDGNDAVVTGSVKKQGETK